MLCLGNVGARLEGFVLPSVELAIGALQLF